MSCDRCVRARANALGTSPPYISSLRLQCECRLRRRAAGSHVEHAARAVPAELGAALSLSHTSCHVCRSYSRSRSASASAAASALNLRLRNPAKQKPIQIGDLAVQLGSCSRARRPAARPQCRSRAAAARRRPSSSPRRSASSACRPKRIAPSISIRCSRCGGAVRTFDSRYDDAACDF